jgi:hypothetical protein
MPPEIRRARLPLTSRPADILAGRLDHIRPRDSIKNAKIKKNWLLDSRRR